MNKRVFGILLCVFLLMITLFVVSCGDGNTNTNTNSNTNTGDNINTDEQPGDTDEPIGPPCKITFVFGNDDNDRTYMYAYGSNVKEFPKETPVREGYTFLRWVSNGKTWYPSKITEDLVVTAEWQANYNNVVFNANGGEGEMKILTLQTDESTILSANKFTRDGYSFAGWATTPKGVVSYKNSSYFVMGPDKLVTLYAVWKPVKYTITYDLASGTQNPANPTGFSIEKAEQLVNPTRDGYTFKGWTVNGETITSTEGYFENLHLVANWELIRYDIIYNGTNTTEHTNPKDYNAEETVVFEDAYRRGYEFKGWFYDKNFTKPATEISAGSAGNVNVYAKFDIINYNITYKLDSGVTNNEQNILGFNINTQFTFLDPSFSVDGMEFDGWYIESTNTKITKINAGEYENDLVIVGKLRLIQYPIIYANDQGLSVPSGTKTYYTVEDPASTLVLPTLSKKGYTFDGWYTEESYINKIETITIDPQNPKAITVFAKLTLEKYTITYVYGSTVANYVVNNPNPTTYDILNVVTLHEANAGDYTTLGWYTDANFQNKIEKISGRTGDLTLYAKWASSNNNPTMLLPAELIDVIYRDGGSGSRDAQLYNLVDGDKVTAGIYSAGNDWYGEVGECAVIEFTTELEVFMINAYVTGNWSHSEITCYDASGNAVWGPYSALGESNKTGEEAEKRVVYESTTSIKVKKIVIKITDYKWNDPKTHKVSEIEIFVKNPDYIPE